MTRVIDILGIDLGTTNSAVAVWDPETKQTKILRNREGERLTPSIVKFEDKQDPLVGKLALVHMEGQPDLVVYSVKRFIGRTFLDQWVHHDQKHMTYCIDEAQQHKVVIRAGGQLVTPAQVAAEVLRKLKQDAEVALRIDELTRAVITVPAYFNEAQRQATKEAGELAGLHVERIINEPTAAALAFGLGAESQTLAVYDLGGGTFDISILHIAHGLFRVKATGGDTHLGGDDFDLVLVQWLRDEFTKRYGVELSSDNALRVRLRKVAEQAKIGLSEALIYNLDLDDLITIDGQLLHLTLDLTRSKYEELVWPFIERSLLLCDDVLEKSGFTKEQIDQVLLVGGQTRTPAVKEALQRRYGWKVNDSVNPDEAVARGASMLAARLCGYLKDQVKLWDVIPLSLGLELANGKMEIILQANQQIPVTLWRRGPNAFTTQQDRQERIRFRVYQGERPIAADNTSIGEVVLNLSTSRPAGEPHIDCMFKVDPDGILHVRAEDADTEGEPVEVTFDRVYRMTQEEVDAHLAEAKAHEKEDEITRRLFELEDELNQLRRVMDSEQVLEEVVLKYLSEMEIAIQARDLEHSEVLLENIKTIL